MDIYQAIWDADMNSNGLQPILTKQQGNISQGYVMVDVESHDPQHKIFKEVYIPKHKRSSYQIFERLIDNYSLNQVNREKNTVDESAEVEEFLRMAIDSAPVRIAKTFVERSINRKFCELQWFEYLHGLWFRQYNWESGKDLSGFEHVFIGEQKGRKLVGHHFWYKYYLEDSTDLDGYHKDQIELTFGNQLEQKPPTADVIILGYHLKAFDYEKKRYIKTIKKRCALFVGLSAEGLLAFGTVRASLQVDAPIHFLLNGIPYQLAIYMSPDGKSIRTFYPIYGSS